MSSKLEVYLDNIKKSGYHLGKMILDLLREKPPDSICQIEAETGQQETYSSVLSRSIRLAQRMRAAAYKPGDVMALGGRNTLNLTIPYFAAHFNGLPVVGVDPNYKFDEIKLLLNLTSPKIIFCEHDTYEDYSKAAKELGFDVKIVTLDSGECTVNKYIAEVDDKEPVDKFKPADFDTSSVYAWLVSTSGTTGVPKVAAFHHQTLMDRVLLYMKMNEVKPGGGIALNVSPVHWISGFFNPLVMMVMNQIKLQVPRPQNIDQLIDIINKYKPVTTFCSPALFALILKSNKHCDLTCFRLITLSGSKVYKQLLGDLKARMQPDAVLTEIYGQTESLGAVLLPNLSGSFGSCGTPMPTVQVKLVDPDTDKDITEPNVTGELWAKGPRFACYYKNPEETEKVLTKDGWFKTGDLLYRDDNHNYFYVDRLKMLIKYRNYHVNPPELEEVIIAHPDVVDVCVTYVQHPEDGQHPVACVVLKPGSTLTAQDIKKMVADRLSVSKHLHGGVVFMSELPKTSTGKVARHKLKEMVSNMKRQ